MNHALPRLVPHARERQQERHTVLYYTVIDG